MANNRIGLTDEDFSDMRRLVVDKMFEAEMKEGCIKKFLLQLMVSCSKTDNNEYRTKIYNKYEEYFETTFPHDMARIIRDWAASEMGARYYAHNQGQEWQNATDAADFEAKLASEVEGIKFNGSVQKLFLKQVRYSDDEVIAEILAAENTLGEGMRAAVNNAIKECDSRIQENLLYNSIKALLGWISDYIEGFDSISPTKEFSTYIENKRREANKSIGKSSVKAQKIDFKK